MSRVLARRDDNWKRMQQYVLDERETFQLLGPGGTPFYGFRHEYQWFPRDGDGVFVRSPVKFDGVVIGETERRKAEADYLKREEARDKRRADREKERSTPAEGSSATDVTGDGVRQALEPGFVSAAYFLKFKFDPGQYALAGRETLEGRQVLRIEYYPTKLFYTEDKKKTDADKDKKPSRGDQFEKSLDHLMNKNSLVTLWVEPRTKQIVKYTFNNVQMDFLPVAWLARLEELRATMTMSEPFKGVWLPRDVEIQFSALLAVGPFDVRYRLEYVDYREAITSGRIKKDLEGRR